MPKRAHCRTVSIFWEAAVGQRQNSKHKIFPHTTSSSAVCNHLSVHCSTSFDQTGPIKSDDKFRPNMNSKSLPKIRSHNVAYPVVVKPIFSFIVYFSPPFNHPKSCRTDGSNINYRVGQGDDGGGSGGARLEALLNISNQEQAYDQRGRGGQTGGIFCFLLSFYCSLNDTNK